MGSSCWESGGPDWLFGLLLGAVFAAGLALAYAFSASLRQQRLETLWRGRLGSLFSLGVLILVIKIDLASVVAIYGPLLIVGVAVVLTRKARLAAHSTSVEGLLASSRLPFLVLGVMSASIAAGSLIYMEVTGKAC